MTEMSSFKMKQLCWKITVETMQWQLAYIHIFKSKAQIADYVSNSIWRRWCNQIHFSVRIYFAEVILNSQHYKLQGFIFKWETILRTVIRKQTENELNTTSMVSTHFCSCPFKPHLTTGEKYTAGRQELSSSETWPRGSAEGGGKGSDQDSAVAASPRPHCQCPGERVQPRAGLVPMPGSTALAVPSAVRQP